LKPQELVELMARHDKTPLDVARIVGISDHTVRRYVTGEKMIPKPVRRLLLIVLGEAQAEDFQ